LSLNRLDKLSIRVYYIEKMIFTMTVNGRSSSEESQREKGSSAEMPFRGDRMKVARKLPVRPEKSVIFIKSYFTELGILLE